MANVGCSIAKVRARRLQVVTLDAEGDPSGFMYISKAVVRVGLEPVQDDGEEFTSKNGSGEYCVDLREDPILRRYNFTLELCSEDPVLEAMLTGGSELTVSANVRGYAPPAAGQSANPNGLGIEWWADAIDVDATYAAFPYWHFGVGKVKLGPAAQVVERGITNLVFTGFTQENPEYDDGPQNDIPAGIDTSRSFFKFLDTSLPDEDCEKEVLAAS